MTDRVHSITVTLERDIRTDDIEHIAGAISMLRGIAQVDLNVSTSEMITAEIRARNNTRHMLINLARALKSLGPAKLSKAIGEIADEVEG